MKISFVFPPPESLKTLARLASAVYEALESVCNAVNDVDYDQLSFARHSKAQNTDASGRVSITYDVQFDLKPDVVPSFEDAGANARAVKVRSHTLSGVKYAGVVIQLYNPGTGAEIATAGVSVTVSVTPRREASTST